jgi:hypothetical protein
MQLPKDTLETALHETPYLDIELLKTLTLLAPFIKIDTTSITRIVNMAFSNKSVF